MRVALLRAINVGGTKTVAMADLRAMADGLGFRAVTTVLHTGNLVFDAAKGSDEQVERLLAAEAADNLDLHTDFYVRSGAGMGAVVSANPFHDEATGDPSHIVVMFLRAAPTRDQEAALQARISGRERVRVLGKHAYCVYPDGIGRSRLTTALIERELGTSGTARNWNTVLKLAALV